MEAGGQQSSTRRKARLAEQRAGHTLTSPRTDLLEATQVTTESSLGSTQARGLSASVAQGTHFWISRTCVVRILTSGARLSSKSCWSGS